MSRKQKEKDAYKRKKNLNSGFAIVAFSVIILMISFMVYTNTVKMNSQLIELEKKETSLSRQIEEEELRTGVLEKKKIYVKTNQYIEEVAKEKLGLTNPDEIVIKARQ